MFQMTVEDIFFIRGRGLVATGRVQDGVIHTGDEVQINGAGAVRVDGIEAFRKMLEQAQAGDNIGLLFAKLDRDHLKKGDVLSVGGAVAPADGTPSVDWPDGLPPG